MITNDGRHLVVRGEFLVFLILYSLYEQGTLRGMDQHVNIVVEECYERVYKADSSVAFVPLGLYLVRGDNVYVPLFLNPFHLTNKQ